MNADNIDGRSAKYVGNPYWTPTWELWDTWEEAIGFVWPEADPYV